MAFLGFPLAVGILRKRAYALVLVYAMFALTVPMAVFELKMAIKRHVDVGGTAFFGAELLSMWFLSVLYYRKRRLMLR